MGKKRRLKTVAHVVKWYKLALEKPGKSNQSKVARVELKADAGLYEYQKPGLSASGIEI